MMTQLGRNEKGPKCRPSRDSSIREEKKWGEKSNGKQCAIPALWGATKGLLAESAVGGGGRMAGAVKLTRSDSH